MIIGSIATQNNINTVLMASAINGKKQPTTLKKVKFNNKKYIGSLENISLDFEHCTISVFINNEKLGEVRIKEEELVQYGFIDGHQNAQDKYCVKFTLWGESYKVVIKDNRYFITFDLTSDEYDINLIISCFLKANARYFGLDWWSKFKSKMKRFLDLE